MSLKLAKMGWLHRIFNTRYPLPVRALLATCAGLTGLAISLDWRSSVVLFHGILRGDDLKSEMRRLSWMGKRGWLSLPMPEDPMFEFCQGLDRAHLQFLERRLTRLCARKNAPLAVELDRLRSLATLAQNAAESAQDAGDSTATKNAFQAQYDQLAKRIRKDELRPHRPEGPKNAQSAKPKVPKGMDLENALAALNDLHALFSAHDLPWFAIAGTFLGVYREGGFIKNDLDIDIGLMGDDVALDQLLNVLNTSPAFHMSRIEHQCDLWGKDQPLNRPAFVRLIHKGGINVDIFLHFQAGDKLCHGTSSLLWENTVFELARYPVYGLEVLGPTPPDLYLKETYGDWQTPATDYNYHRDMPSLTGAHNFLGAEYLLRREVHFGRRL
ncbi:LicD family protein [Pacificibacter sp.]|uniref:LicD family protein n=1 Tax=Pacificibacter sp. TaxID=1917866 RepID=UPI00321BFC89